jgi:hypothetical protein
LDLRDDISKRDATSLPEMASEGTPLGKEGREREIPCGCVRKGRGRVHIERSPIKAAVGLLLDRMLG